MATSYKVVLQFGASDGSTVNHTYKTLLSPETMQQSAITSYMNAAITNGSIFKKVPTSKKAAYMVATEQTDFTV